MRSVADLSAPGRLHSVAATPHVWLFDAALMLLIVLLLGVSSLALTAAGIDYEAADGGPLTKLHPATFLAFLILLAALVAAGNPVSRLERILAGNGAIVLFALAVAFMTLHAAVVIGRPFTPLIDTFGGAAVVYLLYANLAEVRRRKLAWLVHALMALNAVIGIGEFLTGLRLTPIVILGQPIDESRSSALLGHPLANALITACYILTLLMGGGRDLARPIRIAALVLAVVAMIPFGGRMATVSLIAFGGLLVGRRMIEILGGARFDLRSVSAALLVAPAAALVLIPLVEGGFFDRFMRRFTDDKGSAATRSDMLELFTHFNWYDLVWGPDPEQVATWQSIHGLEFGIESFWLGFIFHYGIAASLGFLVALLIFCNRIVRASAPSAALVLLMFFTISSTSVSISAKTTAFSIIVMLLLILLRAKVQK